MMPELEAQIEKIKVDARAAANAILAKADTDVAALVAAQPNQVDQ